MTKCFWKVIGFAEMPPGTLALLPSDQQTSETLHKLKRGDVISTNKPRKPRHPKHHRKYWAMIGLVHESTAISDQFPTTQKLHDAIKGALGYYTTIKLPDGKEFHKLDSTAFENMDQTAFEDFYSRALDIIVTQLVPHMDREDLVREMEGMIND